MSSPARHPRAASYPWSHRWRSRRSSIRSSIWNARSIGDDDRPDHAASSPQCGWLRLGPPAAGACTFFIRMRWRIEHYSFEFLGSRKPNLQGQSPHSTNWQIQLLHHAQSITPLNRFVIFCGRQNACFLQLMQKWCSQVSLVIWRISARSFQIWGIAEVRINDLPRIGALCAASLAGLVTVFVVLQALSLTLASDQQIIENIAKSIERGQITEADVLMTPYGRFVEFWSDCNAISVNLGNINDSMEYRLWASPAILRRRENISSPCRWLVSDIRSGKISLSALLPVLARPTDIFASASVLHHHLKCSRAQCAAADRFRHVFSYSTRTANRTLGYTRYHHPLGRWDRHPRYFGLILTFPRLGMGAAFIGNNGAPDTNKIANRVHRHHACIFVRRGRQLFRWALQSCLCADLHRLSGPFRRTNTRVDQRSHSRSCHLGNFLVRRILRELCVEMAPGHRRAWLGICY